MDLPILRYVDILIGLAVVMLLACTVVTAATQVVCSSGFLRATHLRDGLRQLLTEIDPVRLAPHAGYIAERCLRHPMVGNVTWIGTLWWRIRNYYRGDSLPIPLRNPSDVIQRVEFLLFLLDWASPRSSITNEDRSLAVGSAEIERLAKIREDIRLALTAGGIADPEGTAAAIRQKILQNEAAQPEQASSILRARAVTEAAPSAITAVIHSWYDNTMQRVTNNYQLTAKLVSSGIALLVCVLIQLDAVTLIRRLSQDDKFRDSLVQQADQELKRYEQAQKEKAESVMADAARQRESISASLATLREPKLAIIPEYLLLEKVAQTEVCWIWGDFAGTLSAGSWKVAVKVPSGTPLDRRLPALRAEIQRSPAPVSIRPAGKCLRLVANNSAVDEIALYAGGARLDNRAGKAVDWLGAWARTPGMFLSWVLVSLGAPFWYDLLKKLIGFRSVLAHKDEEERKLRQEQQEPPPATGAAGAPPPPTQAIAGGDDERGDLRETGATG